MGDVHDASCEDILFGDKTAAFQHAGYIRRIGLERVKAVFKAERGHFHCRYRSVREYLYFLNAGTS